MGKGVAVGVGVRVLMGVSEGCGVIGKGVAVSRIISVGFGSVVEVGEGKARTVASSLASIVASRSGVGKGDAEGVVVHAANATPNTTNIATRCLFNGNPQSCRYGGIIAPILVKRTAKNVCGHGRKNPTLGTSVCTAPNSLTASFL